MEEFFMSVHYIAGVVGSVLIAMFIAASAGTIAMFVFDNDAGFLITSVIFILSMYLLVYRNVLGFLPEDTSKVEETPPAISQQYEQPKPINETPLVVQQQPEESKSDDVEVDVDINIDLMGIIRKSK